MENQIVKIDPKEFGLEESKAAQIAAQFQPMLDKMVELEKEYNAVINLDIENPETSQKAKELRLKYVKVRTGTESIHKQQKQFYLAGGRYVDGWKNAQLFASQGIEDKLQSIEKYFENKEKQRIEALKIERAEKLKQFDILEVDSLNLGLMNESVWESFLIGAETNYNAKKELELKLEQERLAAIEAEKQRQLAIEEENKRLKAEKEIKEKELAEERAKAESERKAIEQKALAEKAELDRLNKIEQEKQAKILAQEKAAREKIEAELKAKNEAELKIKQEAEIAEKARIKAEKEAAKAPIKTKLNLWVNSFEIPTCSVQNETTEEISKKFESFKNWAINQINNI